MQISPQHSLIVGDLRLAPKLPDMNTTNRRWCTLGNIGHTLTHATSGVRKTSTLGVDFISSESRVFVLYARSISIISTAGTV